MVNDDVMQTILLTMSGILETAQFKVLESTLQKVFGDIECIRNESLKKSKNTDNQLVLKFIAAKRVEGCSERTLKYYKYELKRFLNDVKVTSIKTVSTDEIREYLSFFQKKDSRGAVTLNNTRRVLSSFYSWLTEEDYVLKNPMRRIHRVRTPRVVKTALSEDEIEILRNKCTYDIRNLAILELLYSSGIRVGELVKINTTDINFEEKSCIVTGKGNAQREIYFDTVTKLHIQQYLKNRKYQNKALFVSLKDENKRIGISGVERMLRNLGKESGIKKVHPHRLRRTMATRAIEKGMHIEHIQKLLGHVQINTTLHYTNISQNNVKIAYHKFG